MAISRRIAGKHLVDLIVSAGQHPGHLRADSPLETVRAFLGHHGVCRLARTPLTYAG